MSNLKGKGKGSLARNRNHGNISVQLYEQANKMESKTRRNQEERLQNILKMHDNNMKRGVGVAHKGTRL